MRYLTALFALILIVAACAGTDGTTAAENGGDGEVAGTVTVGDQTWELSPRQCSVRSNQVSVWGNAVDDPDVEIVFDVFDEGDYNLSVTGPDFEWLAGTGTGVVDNVDIDGNSVSGTATVTQGFSGDTAEASFQFDC